MNFVLKFGKYPRTVLFRCNGGANHVGYDLRIMSVLRSLQ